MSDTCHECGDEFKRLGSHWAMGSCEYPEPSDRQWSILEGLLMGDGWVGESSHGNPYISVAVIEREFLEWCSSQLGPIGCDVRMMRSAEKQSKSAAKVSNLDEPDCSDIFVMNTRRLPSLSRLDAWYDTGNKVFPNPLQLNPLKVKVWFACDGHLQHQKNSPVAYFGACNEMDRISNITSAFEDVGFSPRVDEKNIRFRVDDTRKLLDWMGDPLPGYEHKFSTEVTNN